MHGWMTIYVRCAFALAFGGYTVQFLAAANQVTIENSLTGTDNWLHAQQDPSRQLEIDGFTTKMSYFPGEVVHFKTSSQSWVHSYKVEIYRIGYYNGLGARRVGMVHMTTNAEELKNFVKDTFEILKQPACLFDKDSRLTDCSNWQTTAQWTIPADAVSGVYVALPIHDGSQQYFGSYIPFVVKKVVKISDRVDMLFKTADTTWVAYNRYGDYNLYRGTSNAWSKPDTRASKASYNRPFTSRMNQPLGYEINFVFGVEYPMILWLEKHGYDVSYCASQDVETMHQDGTLLNYKTILSVGHDEYWTGAMKAAHEYARDHGVHLAFFSGNEVFWRTVWDEDTQKSKQQGGSFIVDPAGSKVAIEPKRVFQCRKESHDVVPPATPEEWTGTFRDPRFRPADPESLLTGQNFMVNGIRNDAMTVTAEDAELRFWRNSTFAPNHHQPVSSQHSTADWTDAQKKHQERIVYTSAEGLLGYEWDVFPTKGWRHMGLIPLSTTHIEVTKFLIEDYGTRFEGSGRATHRLSMYRQYNYASSDLANDSGEKFTFDSVCMSAASLRAHVPRPQSTSLVFGAGTVQWSWALSDKHDGSKIRPDRDIQQATLNLFADMGVFPGSFVADMTPPLVLPTASTDTFPPTSTITGAHLKEVLNGALKEVVVEVRGIARDDERGGGKVAAVEVSADGGKTWAMATGRRHWHYSFAVGHLVADPLPLNNSSSVLVSDAAASWMADAVLGKTGMHCVTNSTSEASAGAAGAASVSDAQKCSLLILSRAVDDSGWHEEVDAVSALCAVKFRSVEFKHILGRDGRTHIRNARIVEVVF